MRCASPAFRSLAGALPPALLALAAALPAAAEGVDLVGTWYVLVHYTDDHSANPEHPRWEDKVWVFERKGRRLSWTEYPIVVFDDETGRFERRHTGQYARILHYWEPDDSQRADIRDGLQVNSRGSKKKSLRGSDDDGWSSGRRTSAASASVVTYQEVWSIEGLPSKPVFSRADYMGGGRTDTMEGLTQYATTRIENGVIHGTYERDGSRHGTFRMMPAGEAGALKSQKTQAEVQQQGVRRAIEQSPAARAGAAKAIEAELEAAGLGLSEDVIQQLAGEAVAMFLQGVPQQEIDERLRERVREKLVGFAPSGAEHDDSVRYAWPFDASVPRQLLQGVMRDAQGAAAGQLFLTFRRPDSMKYAFDFDLPVGTPVLAARAGKVARVVDGFDVGGVQQGMARKSNTVVVLHDDGTYAVYGHLKEGIEVELEQRVEIGQKLGESGDTGQLVKPELIFYVQRVDREGETRSVDIRFDDGTAEGVVPVMGAYYGGE